MNKELRNVHRETDDSWRFGCEVEEVFYRDWDDTYWSVGYHLSTDHEIHGLRDGDYTIYQVRPKSVTVTTYVPIEESNDA